MTWNTLIVLLGFGFATAFAYLKAKDLRQWALTQSQLVAEIQKLNGNNPIPAHIKRLQTRPVIWKYSIPEAALIGGFALTAGVAVWNALYPLYINWVEAF